MLDPVTETHHAIMEAYHEERRSLSDRIFRLEALLAQHGIALPAEDQRLGGDPLAHHAACMRVVQSAYDLLANLDELKRMLGSGIELVEERPWRP